MSYRLVCGCSVLSLNKERCFIYRRDDGESAEGCAFIRMTNGKDRKTGSVNLDYKNIPRKVGLSGTVVRQPGFFHSGGITQAAEQAKSYLMPA